MPTYDIISDYTNETEPTHLSFSAGCILAVYRYKWPSTYSRKRGASFGKDPNLAHQTRQHLFVVNDIASASVSHGKANHVATLNVTLHPGRNYVSDILPGDHVFCWMVQSKSDLESLLTRLEEGKDACNLFNDGLKFYGKVHEVRKRMVQAPDGQRQTKFVLVGAGFGELDASIYYDPAFQLAVPGLAAGWLRYYGVQVNSLLRGSNKEGGIQSDKMISAMNRIFFGKGVRKNLGLKRLDVTAGADNPNALVVPKEVAALFGVTEGTKPNGGVGWIDIMELVHGIQRYADYQQTSVTDIETGKTVDNRGKLFNPYISESDSRDRFTGQFLQGTFTPQPAAFSGQKTVMALFRQYLNDAINEMYTALRVNVDGKIMPTLVVRQLPFSSGIISNTFYASKANKKKGVAQPPQPFDIPLTRFSELPRWRIHPILVKSFEVGRSDALRFNYIHVYPEAGYKTGVHPADQFVRDRPVRDDLDIIRSGLRPYIKTVPCGQKDASQAAGGRWMYVLSDILMGQHLTLTGGIELHGVQQPIVPGDNIEYDGVIAHIESVSHTFTQSANGTAHFSTSLRLTHGMTPEQLEGTDDSMHSGIQSDTVTGLEAMVLQTPEDTPENPEGLASNRSEVGAAELGPSTPLLTGELYENPFSGEEK